MGFFKKIFKPVSKVLDKIIPNEIKPALPYLAAFAPVFGPTAGMFGSTMGKRMLLSGGANILGQLSQEGNEGDINLLSAGLGALSGAMTAPGAADTFAGSRIVGTGADGKAITASEYAKLSEGANLGSAVSAAPDAIAGLADPGMATQTIGQFQGPISFSQVVPGGEAGFSGLVLIQGRCGYVYVAILNQVLHVTEKEGEFCRRAHQYNVGRAVIESTNDTFI